MAQAIIYCDRCGKIIPPSEIGRGRAIVGETAGLCPACVEGIPPGEREELKRRLAGEAEAAPAPQAPSRSSRTRAPSTRTTSRAEGAEGLPGPAGQPRSHTGLVVAGLAAGVLGGVAIAVLIAGGKNVEEHASGPVAPGPRPTVTPAGPRKQRTPSGQSKRPPRTPAEPATPAARHIASIKRVFDPSFADYTEGRKALRAFLKEFPDGPEAEKAKARLAEISIGETARAKEALAKAAERAKKLVARGWFDDAGRAFDGVRERFGENEWFKTEGEKKIASALEGIEKSRLDAAKRALARAEGLLGGERFDEARGALADRAAWPEEIRRRAEELVATIASARKAAEEKRRRIDAWIEVVIGLNEAGKTGLAEARAHLQSGRKRLRELGLARDRLEKLERIERRFRSAKLVEAIAGIAFGGARSTVRVRWKGETVAGKVAGVKDGMVKIKPTRGEERNVPISEMAPEDVVAHARVMRGTTKDPVKAGSYYLLRGELDAARKVIDGLADDAALKLTEDIDLVASAFQARKARQIAAAEAARRAAEAAEAARKKTAFDAAVTKGLVAYWKFDEAAGAAKAEDETASYEGRLSDAVRMPGAEGKIGGAYAFDGDDVVTTDLGGFNEDFTWTAWIKTSNLNGAVVGSSERRWTRGGKTFYVYRGKPKVDVFRAGYFEGRTVVNDGEWHHMAVTAEFETAGANDTVKIYVDGELDATRAGWDINKPERNHRIRIGHVDFQGKYFTGLIDEVRIYKRALLAKEIKSIAEGRVMGLPASSGPTEGLVGHWTFDSEDNPAGDSSGKGLHGKMFGTKWTAKGKVGGALEFDGESGFIDLPDISANFTRGFTFAVWAYPTAVKDYARFIDIGNGPARNNLIFCRISRSENLTFEAYQGGRRRELGAKDALALNSWQHFVGTLDESGKAAIYKDGVEIATGQMSLPQDVIRTSNYIGRSNWDGNQFYQGLMDDLRAYNRALTAEEVKALFEGKASPAAPVARPSGPTGGLVGHWTFDNKDNPGGDSSGEGCHGDVFSAKWTAKGKVGGALEFDGERSFVDLPDGFADFTTGFTVAVWAYPTAAKSYARFIDLGNGAMVDNVFFARRGTDTRMRFEVQDGSMGIKTIDTAGAIELDRWQHFAATIDEAGNAVIYRDGAKIDSRTTGVPRNVTRTANYIGKSNWGRDGLYQGLMDDVRVYNRALSGEEVKALFEGKASPAAAPSPVAPGLVAHWKFDEGSGATARDSSGKGRDGKIKGATWTQGKLGGALEFDGKKAYVQVGAPDVRPPWTAAMWVRRRDDSDAGALLDSAASSLRLEQGNDCVGFTRYRVADYHFGHAVPVGVWTHLAFVGTASGTKLYVNGVGRTQPAAAIGPSKPQGPAVISAPMAGIGGPGPRASDRLKGALDDVRVYNRALSADEIRVLSGGTAVSKPPAAVPAKPVVSLPTGPKKPLPGETGRAGEWAPGLVCEIFKGLSFKERVGVRIDPSPVCDFGTSPPDLGLAPGNYSFRWSGYFLAPVTGRYFFDRRTGFTSVKIDGKNVYGLRDGIELAKGLHEFRARAKGSKTEMNFRMPQPVRLIEDLCYHSVPEPGSLGPFAKLTSGLAADYYQGRRKVSAGRPDGTNFDAGNGPVCTMAGKDGFAVRMKAYLLAPRAGAYEFELRTGPADLVRVDVGGKPLLDTSMKPDKGAIKATKNLPAGLHKFAVSFVDKSGSAKLDLRWKRAAHNKIEPIPAQYLLREAAKPELVGRKGLAPGARCRIYKGAFSKRDKPAVERLDLTLRHDWKDKDPTPGVPRGGEFNVTWSGALVIPKTGRYSFSMQRYGGARLVVNRRPVIDGWKDNNKREQEGPVALRAGMNKFQLDYFHTKARAGLELYWSGPDFPLRPVSARDLAHEGAFAVAGPEAKPQDKPAPAKPGADKAPGAVPGPNLVANGGFEEAKSSGEIARGWRRGQWGPKKGGFTARADRTNSHGGARSLLLRANAEGIHPGATTTLTSPLEPGKYEIRFWASADVGKAADVRVHLAGRDALSESIGEDWKEFTGTVDITAKEPRPTLRLYTTTTVRVWFDDVVVRALAGQ